EVRSQKSEGLSRAFGGFDLVRFTVEAKLLIRFMGVFIQKCRSSCARLDRPRKTMAYPTKRFTALVSLMLLGTAYGQRGAGDWMTSGGDPQRSGWIRTDVKISAKNMAAPGFGLVWKVKVGDGAMSGVTPPALIDFYIGYRGFRTLSFFGANSNKVVAVDSDLA